MRIEPTRIINSTNTISNVAKTAVQKVTSSPSTKIMSAAAATALAAEFFLGNPSLEDKFKSLGFSDETAKKMRTHTHNDKKVYNENSLKALDAMKKYNPRIYNFIAKNPQAITTCEFKTAQEEQDGVPKFYVTSDFFNIILSLRRDKNNNVGIGSLKETYKFPDGKIIKTETEAVKGTDKLKKTVITQTAQGKITKTEQTDLVSDSVGIMHKDYIITEYYDRKRPKEAISYGINGSMKITHFAYNDKLQLSETMERQYSPSGVIESETKTTITYNENIPTRTIENVDYKNNTKTTAIKALNDKILTSEIREIINPQTGKVRKEILEQSEVEGLFNSTIIDEDGKVFKECQVDKGADGSVRVQKHLTSLDGTTTEYEYKSSADKDDISLYYQIKSKDGEILSTVDRSFKRISAERTYSSLNGHGYAMTYSNDGVAVTDLVSNQTRQVRYTDIIDEKKSYDMQKAKAFVGKLPADMILNMVNQGIKINLIEDKMKSSFAGFSGINTGDDIFVFAHESGHSKDGKLNHVERTRTRRVIANNKLFRETYEAEKSEFLNAFTDVQQEYIKYFINGIASYGGIDGAPAELIAETNALFSTGFAPESLAARSHYLQKYFPRTIAMASKFLMPDGNVYVGK